MSEDKIITKKITPNLNGSVISAKANTNLEQSLWAVNWLDLKRKWMYELYNQLVFGHVRKIGAQPIFKGFLRRSIMDNERLRRDLMLIVKYPRADSFLNMISSRLFQVKGLLRSYSVRHFQFGFMQSQNFHKDPETATKYNGNLKYLIHVCEGSQTMDFQSLIEFAAKKEVFPHFIGQKSALFGLQKRQNGLKTLDFMLSHVLVFSGFDDEALISLTQSEYYQDFIHSVPANFIGIYDRKI